MRVCHNHSLNSVIGFLLACTLRIRTSGRTGVENAGNAGGSLCGESAQADASDCKPHGLSLPFTGDKRNVGAG